MIPESRITAMRDLAMPASFRTAKRLRLPLALRKAITTFWASAVLTFCLYLVMSVWGHHGQSPQTRWNPLSGPLLGDLMEYPGTYCLFNTTVFFQKPPMHVLPERLFSAVAYPPFAAVVLAPICRLGSPVWNFLCLAAVIVALGFWLTRKALRRAGLFSTSATWLPLSLILFSFPYSDWSTKEMSN